MIKNTILLALLVLTCAIPMFPSCNNLEGQIEQPKLEFPEGLKPFEPDVKLPKKKTETQVDVKAEDSVLICNSKTAYAFHIDRCSGLSRCKASISKVSKSAAEAKGYKPCGYCY